MKNKQRIAISILTIIVSGLLISNGIHDYQEYLSVKNQLYTAMKKLNSIDTDISQRKAKKTVKQIDLVKLDKLMRNFSVLAVNKPIKNQSEYLDYKKEIDAYGSSSRVFSELEQYRKPSVVSTNHLSTFKIKSLNRTGEDKGHVFYLIDLENANKDKVVLEIQVDAVTNQIIECHVNRGGDNE